MPFYIFTRVKGDAAWELVEAIKIQDVAIKALADYRSFLREQVDAEVILIQADSVEEARNKLEFDPTDN